MKILKPIVMSAAAICSTAFMAAPANAYYVVVYNYIDGISGAEYYCDDGTLYYSIGLITGQVAYVEYYTGSPPC